MIGYFYRSRFRLSVRLSVRGNRVVFSVQTGSNRLKPVFCTVVIHHRSCTWLCVSRVIQKMVQIWSSVSKIGQNRHIEIAFLKLNWGQFRILSTVWSHLKRRFNWRSKVMWGQMSCDRRDHVIRKQTYRCFILAIGGLRMIHIGFIVIKHIVWLIEYARLKIKI